MKVFSIFGASDSGKTTTTEIVIAELCRRGYSVGSIKDIHFNDFVMDKEGTDTWRHKQAGSQLVTARGLYETDLLFIKRLPLKELIKFYNQDFLVLEGANSFLGPGIISAHNEEEIDRRNRSTIFAIVGRISEKITDYKGLPVYDARKDVTKLTDLIEEMVPEWTNQEGWFDKEV